MNLHTRVRPSLPLAGTLLRPITLDLGVPIVQESGAWVGEELTFNGYESADTLRCALVHNRDLFAERTMARLAAGFEAVAAAVAADPDVPLSGLIALVHG